jgi:FixJ family two-component response regulator
MDEPKRVSIVDDDESVRESLPDLLRSFGFAVEAFPSAEQFLASASLEGSQCLILDIGMPGMTGPELQVELARLKRTVPIVFITARADDRAVGEVLQRGAVACLIKPFAASAIVEAVNTALART